MITGNPVGIQTRYLQK